jgi:hypothetical protein
MALTLLCTEKTAHIALFRCQGPKIKNSFLPNKGESNKIIAQKENSLQDLQLEGSAYGLALKNNENSHD